MKIPVALFLMCASCITTPAQQTTLRESFALQQAPPPSTPTKSPDTPPPPVSSVDPKKEAAIRSLLEVVGTRELMKQMVNTTTARIKPLLESSLPPGEYRAELIDLYFAKFQTRFNVDDLIDRIIPIYDKYLTLEDVEGLTRFYETALGKKSISVLPQLMQECQSVGGKLGEQIGRQAMVEVLDEHPELKKSLEEAAAQKKP